jgi:hypothetical protein
VKCSSESGWTSLPLLVWLLERLRRANQRLPSAIGRLWWWSKLERVADVAGRLAVVVVIVLLVARLLATVTEAGCSCRTYSIVTTGVSACVLDARIRIHLKASPALHIYIHLVDHR